MSLLLVTVQRVKPFICQTNICIFEFDILCIYVYYTDFNYKISKSMNGTKEFILYYDRATVIGHNTLFLI